MIVGIGTDLCEVERIAEALERQGLRFQRRICSEQEQRLGGRRLDPALFYASRFAAKEACAKALGTGITTRVRWTDIEVLAGPGGRPVLSLSGGALRRARRLAGRRELRFHISIAHDGLYASAFVILEAE
jgi:holo-[acyl-carrier protein] synthase